MLGHRLVTCSRGILRPLRISSALASVRYSPHGGPTPAPPTRQLTTTICAQQQQLPETRRPAMPVGAEVLCHVKLVDGSRDLLEAHTSEGRLLQYPALWLRSQCQCPLCYSTVTESRSLIMEDWSVTEEVKAASVTATGGLQVEWSSGHRSEYRADWLLERAWTDEAKTRRRHKHHLPKTLWSCKHELPRHSYGSLLVDDQVLLSVLQHVEQHGAVLLTDVPDAMHAGYDMAEHIGICKKTNFGYMCNLYPEPGATNLAYTTKALNLHNDLAFYDETPGVVLLHALTQHTGEGGDSQLSDGFQVADLMRREYPDEYHMLCTANAYFMDRGIDKNSETKIDRPYYKLARGPVINLGPNGEPSFIRFSNHLLDSFVDIPLGKVNDFYKALKLFYDLNKEHSIRLKLKDGEMIFADNHRCLHGRMTVVGDSNRHLVASYLTWDEARCKRRRLEDALMT